MSRQACSLAAIDFGFSGAAFDFAAVALPFGLTWASGLPPTIGGLAGGLLCAMAVAEYRTATSRRIFLISLSLSFSRLAKQSGNAQSPNMPRIEAIGETSAETFAWRAGVVTMRRGNLRNYPCAIPAAQ